MLLLAISCWTSWHYADTKYFGINHIVLHSYVTILFFAGLSTSNNALSSIRPCTEIIKNAGRIPPTGSRVIIISHGCFNLEDANVIIDQHNLGLFGPRLMIISH